MNTVEDLINKYNIHPTNAKYMIDTYSGYIDTEHGELTVVDINYIGDGHRELTRMGYTVIRFSGQEINADVNKCVREIIDILTESGIERKQRKTNIG